MPPDTEDRWGCCWAGTYLGRPRLGCLAGPGHSKGAFSSAGLPRRQAAGWSLCGLGTGQQDSGYRGGPGRGVGQEHETREDSVSGAGLAYESTGARKDPEEKASPRHLCCTMGREGVMQHGSSSAPVVQIYLLGDSVYPRQSQTSKMMKIPVQQDLATSGFQPHSPVPAGPQILCPLIHPTSLEAIAQGLSPTHKHKVFPRPPASWDSASHENSCVNSYKDSCASWASAGPSPHRSCPTETLVSSHIKGPGSPEIR